MSTVPFTAQSPQVLLSLTPPIATPSRPAVVKRSYRALFEIIQAHPGKWFSVLPEGMAGTSLPDKRRNLLQAARIRGLRLQTSVQNGAIFCRLAAERAEVLNA